MGCDNEIALYMSKEDAVALHQDIKSAIGIIIALLAIEQDASKLREAVDKVERYKRLLGQLEEATK